MISPALSEAAKSARDEAMFLELAAKWLAQEAGVDACDIFGKNSSGGLVLRGTTHIPESLNRLQVGPKVGIIGSCLSSREVICIPQGLDQDPRSQKLSDIEEDHFLAGMALPIPIESGAKGVVLLRNEAVWGDAEAQVDQVKALVSQFEEIWTIFSSAYTHGEEANRFGAVTQVAQTFSSSPYLEEILQLLVTMTAQQFGYKVVTVRLLDSRREELILRATQATNRAYQNKRAIKLNESIAGRVITEMQPSIVADVQDDPEYVGHDLAQEQGLRSMICLPLSIQNRAVGVISCYSGEVHDFSDDEVAALEALARQAAVSIEHARLQVRRTLMQEMHHRVKNNLQQVASLLRLEMSQDHAQDPKQALSDSLGRILAIASVHELLSRDDLDLVSIKSIAENLTALIQQSVVGPTQKIQFQITGGDGYLNTTQATQVTLVLNELIHNAVEHGFAEADEGLIHISIGIDRDEIILQVVNTGDPLPDDFGPESEGLGLQIIQSLSRGLGGTFQLGSVDEGTQAILRFTPSSAE